MADLRPDWIWPRCMTPVTPTTSSIPSQWLGLLNLLSFSSPQGLAPEPQLEQTIIVNYHSQTQCLRMDFNKKSGPKPKTVAGWKGTPKGSRKTINENPLWWAAVTKFSKLILGYYYSTFKWFFSQKNHFLFTEQVDSVAGKMCYSNTPKWIWKILLLRPTIGDFHSWFFWTPLGSPFTLRQSLALVWTFY